VWRKAREREGKRKHIIDINKQLRELGAKRKAITKEKT